MGEIGERWIVESHLFKVMGEKGHTMAMVISGTGLSRDAVRRLYYSEGDFIHFDTLAAICRFYMCDVGDILKVVPESESIAHTIPKRKRPSKKEKGQ